MKNAFYGETGSQKGIDKTLTIKNTFKCQQNNNLSVFNVQIIKLYSLGSWNFYVRSRKGLGKVSERSRKGLGKVSERSRKGLDYNTAPDSFYEKSKFCHDRKDN